MEYKKKVLMIVGLVVVILFITDMTTRMGTYLKDTSSVRRVAITVETTRWLDAQREALDMNLMRDGLILLAAYGAIYSLTYVLSRKA